MDVEALVQPVSEQNPAGENLEYDSAYCELQRIISAPFDLDGSHPDSIDWKSVHSDAQTLLNKTKDLRVMLWLAQASLMCSGYVGFSQCIALINTNLQQYWETLYPALDPDDDNDPTERVNIISSLSDRQTTIHLLMRVPMVNAKGIGTFSLRDYLIAKGEIEAKPETYDSSIDKNLINAALQGCDIETLKANAQAATNILENLSEIDQFFLEKVGGMFAPSLSLLSETTKQLEKLLLDNLAARGEFAVVGETEADAEEPGENNVSKPVVTGEIRSREDATRMMDKISEYFMKHEPSSPVPMLMQRAKRLSNLGFMEILKELAPKGLEQAQLIGGLDDSQSK